MLGKGDFHCDYLTMEHDIPCGFSLEDEFAWIEGTLDQINGPTVETISYYLVAISALVQALEVHKRSHS
jgi:hypothetical protein